MNKINEVPENNSTDGVLTRIALLITRSKNGAASKIVTVGPEKWQQEITGHKWTYHTANHIHCVSFARSLFVTLESSSINIGVKYSYGE